MKTTAMSQDAENFLAALMFAYPESEQETIDGKTIYDFSPEFITAVSNFCEAFRAYLYPILSDDQFSAIDECPRSFGGNLYFSLSGHGCGFWDSDDTEHLQAHLDAFSGDHYRFEEIMLDEDENGKLDLSYLPEFIAEYRRRMFTPAIATHSA